LGTIGKWTLPEYFCRGTVEIHGLNEDLLPVDEEGNVATALSLEPWTPAEEAEIKARTAAYEDDYR
jgi:hypothetical protein